LQYIARASFHTLHTPCAQRIIDSRRIPLSYGVFRTSIHAVVAGATISHRHYVHGSVVLELLNFLRLQQPQLLNAISSTESWQRTLKDSSEQVSRETSLNRLFQAYGVFFSAQSVREHQQNQRRHHHGRSNKRRVQVQRNQA
jgi:hypothetical protein